MNVPFWKPSATSTPLKAKSGNLPNKKSKLEGTMQLLSKQQVFLLSYDIKMFNNARLALGLLLIIAAQCKFTTIVVGHK